MNLLFYLSRYPAVGGIETVTSMIIEKLIVNNRISIISHSQQDEMSIHENVRLFKMPDGNKWYTKENYMFADRIVSNENFDAIIYQDSYAPTEKIVCTIAEKYNVPLYVFEHNSPLFVFNKRNIDPITTTKGFLRRILHPYLLRREIKRKRYLLQHCRKYVLLSKQFIPEFCELVGVHNDDVRITYINNPVSQNVASKIQKENIILCVSRLAKEKGVDKMLYLWKDLSLHLSDWKFQIVGDGEERVRLEAIVANERISRVEFIGFAKPTEYYQKAKIFWMTSKYEGWGMTLVEAMQQRCVPIAYHSFSSLTDIIDDNINGFVIPYNDVASFESTVVSLANDPEKLYKMSQNAQEKVSKFEIDKILNEWQKLFT